MAPRANSHLRVEGLIGRLALRLLASLVRTFRELGLSRYG